MTAMTAVTIVMIEDDDGHSRLIEKNIRRAGVTNRLEKFSTAKAGLAYLHKITTPAPLLVLLDLNLPDASGIDVLAEMKSDEKLKRSPVIILTTTDDKDEIQRCYDLGCNVYITKPVDYQDFSDAIRQLGLFLTVMQVPESK